MSKKTPLNWKLISFIAGLLVFIYFYPRVLISTLGEDNPWTSYFYMYGFGLVTFLIGMYVITTQKALDFKRGWEKKWFYILLGGFVFFSTLHGLWVILSLHMPYKGGV